MKNLLFVILMLTVFTSCTKSQDNTFKDWSSVKYYYSRGPLPPPYHYNFDVTVNKDGASSLIYNMGYGEGTPLNYTFTVSAEDLSLLEEKICKSKLATGKVVPVPENVHPVGGPMENVKLTIVNPNPDLDQPPKVFESPFFPAEEFKSDLNELYEFIQKLVPRDVWFDVNGKQTEYQSNYKK